MLLKVEAAALLSTWFVRGKLGTHVYVSVNAIYLLHEHERERNKLEQEEVSVPALIDAHSG